MTPVEIARAHVARRTPWRHQARGPDWLDCIGLVRDCFAQYGLQDRRNYDRNPRGGQLESEFREQFGFPIPKGEMREEDVVLMAFPNVIRHVGIVANHWLGGLSLIHTWAGGPRCVCETPIDAQWLRRIKIVHRWETSP